MKHQIQNILQLDSEQTYPFLIVLAKQKELQNNQVFHEFLIRYLANQDFVPKWTRTKNKVYLFFKEFLDNILRRKQQKLKNLQKFYSQRKKNYLELPGITSRQNYKSIRDKIEEELIREKYEQFKKIFFLCNKPN